MNKSESNGRIRQVAIVLSSVDATTARQLLGQLPAVQARLVRQQMATLDNVTSSERETASRMLAQLKSQARSTVPAASRSPQQSSQMPGFLEKPGISGRSPQPSSRPSSPAEALLSSVPSTIDRIELTNEYAASNEHTPFSHTPYEPSSSLHSGITEEGFHPVQRRTEYPFQNPSWIPTWQQWSGEELARLLMSERPTLIAAVLLQAPAELGSVILQSLPSPTATSVLAALPQLHTTDPSVLQEIYNQLHQRLADFQRQSTPENAGMTKLQAILEMVSNETRQRFEQGLAATQPLLAHALGVPISNAANATQSSAITKFDNLAIEFAHKVDRREEELLPTVRFPSRTAESVIQSESNASLDSFESLIALSLDDFAMVLRSMDPQTILLAASGASRAMQNRIEELVDPKEIKRLRARLQGLRMHRAQEKQSAQEKIAQAANTLLQQGRIARLVNMTVLAAA